MPLSTKTNGLYKIINKNITFEVFLIIYVSLIILQEIINIIFKHIIYTITIYDLYLKIIRQFYINNIQLRNY